MVGKLYTYIRDYFIIKLHVYICFLNRLPSTYYWLVLNSFYLNCVNRNYWNYFYVIDTYLDANWRALQPSTSFSEALHPEYLISHSTQSTCPLMDASCKAVYPTHDFLFKFLIPWIFRNLETKLDIIYDTSR